MQIIFELYQKIISIDLTKYKFLHNQNSEAKTI